jgi:hypothetical protein
MLTLFIVNASNISKVNYTRECKEEYEKIVAQNTRESKYS